MSVSADSPVVVVGAGVSGLACAQVLVAAGRRVTVLERARGVGGRCATRRIDGQPVDFGLAFLHGRDTEFIAAIEGVQATLLRDWPRDVHGRGRPCQPAAFAPGEKRFAFAEGLTAFPKHMARTLDVRLRSPVAALEPGPDTMGIRLEDGSKLETAVAVLAVAAEETSAFLAELPRSPEIESAHAILEMSRSQCCLALLAAYPEGAPAPPWNASYPEDSQVLQVAIHDSSKRTNPAFLAMVYQAHPSWSRQHQDDPGWPETLLAEASRLFGAWAGRPRFTEAHCWRFARGDLSVELAEPLLLGLPGGARLGLTGDRFAPGGGVQGAWLAGRRLAARLLSEERP